MKFKILFISLLLCSSFLSFSQRKFENLNRGVVAVKNASSAYFISWRYLATDAESVQFNLYAKKSGVGTFSKLNATPLTVTSYQSTTSQVADGTQLYVKPVVNGVEGAASSIFTINASGFNAYRSAYLDISFNPAVDGLDISQYSTKFVWPADLDGDGEYDFVVDRLSTTGGNHKVQAYLKNGTLLWTIDVGPNVSISQGQDDMVISYDMDGDGKAEVIIKSSDGTSFADGKGVNGSVSLDTDNDGIVDYGAQNVKNPPQYITVIDGLTGLEKNSVEMTYPSNYTRTNKAIFMGEEYSNLNGHMAILYLDGKHPSVGFIYKTRTSSDQYHWYYASAYGYNAAGQWVNQYNWERGTQDAAEFHSIRVADADFDGRDELLDGGYGIKYDGTLAFNAHISHGDRFRVGDINPERPGLETFAIQQNASSMLGMLIYDAATGAAITKKYMSGVGDVGRGECMDIDSTRLGYEFYSTMDNIYDAKGNVIYEGDTPFPHEGIWWDGDLLREELSSADGNGFNTDIRKYSITSHTFGSRLIEMAKMTNYAVKSEYGVRPAFFGDIAGDWREEVILEKRGSVLVNNEATETCAGFVGFSTDYTTAHRLYCLMQNPAYRMQATTKGYYQSAFPDYYLGAQMPAPPVPPIQSAKLTWNSGSTLDLSSSSWKLADETTMAAFANGDDVMFDISGTSTSLQMIADLAPSKVWAMNPSGKDYTISGTGKFTGAMELVKSMYGNFTLSGNHTYTGKTTVSEGTLTVNGSLASQVDLRAKGTLAGNAILNGGVILNKGLNIEGGRLAPGNGLDATKLGKITINSAVTMSGDVNLHFDIIPSSVYKNDSVYINGNLTTSGINKIIINTLDGTLLAGTYSLMKWTGTHTGNVGHFKIEGISGIPVSLLIENSTLKLVVNAVRATDNIVWNGNISNVLDFTTNNFVKSASPTYFVTGDAVTINDDAVNTSLVLNDDFKAASWQIANQTKAITLTGTGGFSGTGTVAYSGTALVDVQTTGNSYTGVTSLNNARVQVSGLSEAGTPGSLGAAGVSASNLTLNNSALLINAVNTYTDRGITLSGVDTLQMVKSNGFATITGVVAGSGKLVKNGPGQLNLSGSASNTYAGGTHITGGTLALGSVTMNKTGLGTGPLTIDNGGVLKMYYTEDDYTQNPNWSLIVPDGETATLIASGRCNINGTISGGGTLNYQVPYLRADLVSTGTNFTGTLNVTTDSDGGDFRITTNSIGFPAAQIVLNDLVGMSYHATLSSGTASTATTAIVGSLAGTSGSKLGTGKWQIGSDNRDAVFNGVINSGAILTKVGTGNWTLTGANLCSSSINVNAGKLTVNNTTGSGTGTSAVVVASAGTLSGTGVVSGAATVNGSLQGRLSFGSSLTLGAASQSTLNIDGFSAGQFDSFKVTGLLTKAGILNIQVSGSAPEVNTSINLIEAGSQTGSFAQVNVTPGYSYNTATGVLTYIGNVGKAFWNGDGNWSDATKWSTSAVPGRSDTIVVQSGHVHMDQDIANDSIIILQPGSKLTVNAGKTLTSRISMLSDLTGTATLVNLGTTHFVSSVIKQKVKANRNWYFASPLQTARFGNLIDPANLGSGTPLLGPEETSVGVLRYWSHDEVTGGWNEISNLTSTIEPMKGYIVHLAVDTVLTFNGALNDGNMSISLNRTENGLSKRGFNLVGNPYPSYLNWDMVEKTNVTSTIWYRTKNNANAYVFDTYNASGGIATGLGVASVSNMIPPMQSFWVRVASGQTSGSLQMTNAMRSHKDLSGNLLKAPASISKIIRLQISNGIQSDETVVYYHPNASNDLDQYDSPKMFNNQASIPEIYTLSGDEKMVINGFNNYRPGEFMALGYDMSVAGVLTISATQIQNFDEDIQLILVDHLTGKSTDLTESKSYTFSTTATSGTDRFSILLKSASITTGLDTPLADVKVYESDNQIVVSKVVLDENTTVRVFDLTGNEIYVQQLTANQTVISRKFSDGVYLISIENGTEKKMFKISI